MNKGMNMKLQVTIGSCTVNTTSQGLGRIFEQEDAAVFNDMLNLSRTLCIEGDTISQYSNGVCYEIRCVK